MMGAMMAARAMVSGCYDARKKASPIEGEKKERNLMLRGFEGPVRAFFHFDVLFESEVHTFPSYSLVSLSLSLSTSTPPNSLESKTMPSLVCTLPSL